MTAFYICSILTNLFIGQFLNNAGSPVEFKFVRPFSTSKPHRFIINAESTHSYDIRHYRLDLELPMNSGAMNTRERIVLTSRVSVLDTFSLHFDSLVCDSVKQGNNNLVFTTGSGYLTITLSPPIPLNDSVALDIHYHRVSNISNLGVYFYRRSSSTSHNLFYSVTAPSDSRYWFACFDEPWDKAEQGCQINITVPDSFTACANGILDSTVTNGTNQTKTYFWTHRYPISTYLMCFAASRYATFSHWFHYTPDDSMEVKYFVWPEDSIYAVSSFVNMIDMLEFYSQSNMYDLYPFITEKYGMVEVNPFIYAGMEHQTMVTIYRDWVRWGSESGISHELAHMWWGDMVTCLDWRNVWLNEGFATYSEALYHKYRHGLASFINLMNQRASYYFNEDQRTRFSVYNPPPESIYAYGTIYCKGSWILHMLRYLAGDTTSNPGIFFQALRAYGDSFRFGNANTEDYKRINQQVTGLDLTTFFSEWVYQAGYPNYRVGWYCQPVDDNWQLVLNISQNNGNNAPSIFHIPVQILVRFTNQDTLLTIPINSNPQPNVFSVSQPVNSIVFDPNSWILKRVTTVNDIEELTNNEGEISFSVLPNPFQNRVNFKIKGKATVRIEIFDISGRQVKSLFRPKPNNETVENILWDGKDEIGKLLSGGVYFVKLTAGKKTGQLKLLLLR
jgi:aminopeptidase N